jgi:hypothetical protein
VCSTYGTVPNKYDTTDTYIYSERAAGAVGGVNSFSG